MQALRRINKIISGSPRTPIVPELLTVPMQKQMVLMNVTIR